MNVSISYYTARGKRPNNEDAVSILESDTGLLAIVADGLGGHADGEIASKQAVTTLNKLLQSEIPNEDMLIDAIQQASRDIFHMRNPRNPMHTTIASLWLGDCRAVVANVGDTRVYQFRDGKIVYQSLDHSVAQMAVLVGQLLPHDIRHSKERNRLLRVLGTAEIPKVDCRTLEIFAGDHFLLCSDGFWEAVTENTMRETLIDAETVNQWLTRMRCVVETVQKPFQDNHTAMAIRFI